MALQNINVGSAPDDGSGDPLRTAFQKVNSNNGLFAPVALTGAYADLTGQPGLAAVALSGAYADLTGTPVLAPVATSGAYSDLSGLPTILKGNVTTTDPTVSNDNTQGFAAGSNWLNTATGVIWTALSVATGAAVWEPPTEVLISAIVTSGSQATVAFPTLPT